MKTFERLTKNRQDFLEALVRVVNKSFEEQKEFKDWGNEDIRPVQRIFINAPWGMGKTLFADAIKEYLSEKYKEINTLYVNSWRMDFYDEPMKALIAEMSEGNIIKPESTEKAKKFLKNCGKIFFGKILKNFLLKRFNLNDKDIEEMKSFFNGLNTSELEDYKNYKKLLEEFKDTLSKEKSPKIIIIDELDRCRPDYAIQLLEIIKHIFDVKNIIFLFLINREQLESIVSTIYMNSNLSNKYFEKFYDVELNLPKANYEELNEPEFEIVNYFEEYRVDGNNFSENRDLIIQKIFLDIAFVINRSFSKISIRNIKKLLKKFNILKNSLIEEEKKQYILILSLIEYFFNIELDLKLPKGKIIEEYLEKVDSLLDIIKKKIIIGIKNNSIIGEKHVENIDINNIMNVQNNYLYKNIIDAKMMENNYIEKISEKDISFNNLKIRTYKIEKDDKKNIEIFLSINIKEATISSWLEKKYNFIE
ncbi:KAP family P-loop NTPase fold protein [Fusobacterium massiliense]|uniref:KAP family P-loop NTPase fold protein n=1 Tax=Fusobacterium massiliense TaxID=1852365 RepID=UPI00093BF261|nr:P-loop NTPase fold protein [Fusobacterium massiliense]